MSTTVIRPPSIANFRDVGGHLTSDGHRVRGGLLYRSVELGRASAADLAALEALGVRTVCDLRTDLERERSPDRLPRGARLVVLDVLADSDEADPAALFALFADPPTATARLSGGGTERFYLASYLDMVRLPSARKAYARLYRTLAQAPDRPALVHCTTGKDRTGWAVAVLLLLLGVPTQSVIAEYLLSDAAVRVAFASVADDFASRGGDPAVLEPMLGVDVRYLAATMRVAAERYGSIDGYVADGLGLEAETLATLRRAFLEPV